MTFDLEALTHAELEDLRKAVAAEQDRRSKLAVTQDMLDTLPAVDRAAVVLPALEQIQAGALAAKGWVDGGEWVEPTGAHDAYPIGTRATYDGRTWVNELASNPFPPGVTGWVEEAPEGEYPQWWQPLGAHDAHVWGTGVRAWHDGTLWESVRDENVWPPGTGDDYWVEVNDDPEEPEEPEEPGEPAHPEWVRPTGAHDAYSVDDTVTYQGGVYRSKINGNTWSPTEHPAGWERLGDA